MMAGYRKEVGSLELEGRGTVRGEGEFYPQRASL